MERFPPMARTALVLLAASAGGCLVSQSSDVHRYGTDVPESAFAQITPGTTMAAWVRGTLGEPSVKQMGGPRDEVWRYEYTERVDSSGYVFLIFGGRNHTETTRKAVVEFTDGIVVRKWRG